jgi:Ni,Fe-hydrogenase III large subunit
LKLAPHAHVLEYSSVAVQTLQLRESVHQVQAVLARHRLVHVAVVPQ